jgi:hypothetical protein
MFKFVTADTGTPSPKRKQSQRACETCRKRKKRCNHLPSAEFPRRLAQVPPNNDSSFRLSSAGGDTTISPSDQGTVFTNQEHSAPSGVDGQQQSTSPWIRDNPTSNSLANDGTEATQDHSQVDRNPLVPDRESLGSRFIGDLCPEGVLLSATSPGATRGASLDGSVGVWTKGQRENIQHVSAVLPSQSPSSLFSGSAPLIQKVLLPMLTEESLSTLPRPDKIAALAQFYFDKIHPIFPVIDEPRFHDLQPADPGKILLQQAVCLAASKNYVTKEHLILPGSDSPLSFGEFGTKLFAAMRLSVELGLVTDKIILIQALTLMSHFTDGPERADLSPQLCGRAVHYVQSIGLHLSGQQRNYEDQYGITLLCCVWALDRMNAAFHGRPVLIHERDLGVDLNECFSQQRRCFRLLLNVISLLDKVIAFYRPSSSVNREGADAEFPAFEELITSSGSSQIVTPLLGM